MESFLHSNNKGELSNIARKISKSKLIDKIDDNKNPIRINCKIRTDLVYNELNPSKEKTKKIMNNYFKSAKSQRDNNELSYKKEFNDSSNNNSSNPENQNISSDKQNIIPIKTSNELINNNNTNEQISKNESLTSEDIMNINNKNEKKQDLTKTNSSLNSFRKENNMINSPMNQVNLNNTVNNRFKSPLVSSKYPIKGRNSVRNSLLSRNFYFQNTQDDILKHQQFSNVMNKRNSLPNTARITMNNLRKSNYFIQNLSYSMTENDDVSNNNETIELQLEIKIQDLVYLEKLLYNILNSFEDFLLLKKYCIEWWTFYNYSSFYNVFNNFYPNNKKIEENKILHEYSVLEFLSIIVLYEVIKDIDINQSTINCLNKLMNLVYQNFLVICDYIISITLSNEENDLWIKKLNHIIQTKKEENISKKHFNLLKNRCNTISILLKNILKLYNNNIYVNENELTFFLKRISRILINTLNQYLRQKINSDLVKKYNVQNQNENDALSEVPFLLNNKIFTLVIELDDTIISLQKDSNGLTVIIPRPGLKQFLREMNKIYEIIIFTSSTSFYADPILNSVDKKQHFFKNRLYRKHTVFINNVYVKDLSKLGRDLSKIIIIDNRPENFQLQKENGIYIKSFFGNDKNDKILDNLMPILKNIASDPNNDVREEIKKFHKEIYLKVTTNLNQEL